MVNIRKKNNKKKYQCPRTVTLRLPEIKSFVLQFKASRANKGTAFFQSNLNLEVRQFLSLLNVQQHVMTCPHEQIMQSPKVQGTFGRPCSLYIYQAMPSPTLHVEEIEKSLVYRLLETEVFYYLNRLTTHVENFPLKRNSINSYTLPIIRKVKLIATPMKQAIIISLISSIIHV